MVKPSYCLSFTTSVFQINSMNEAVTWPCLSMTGLSLLYSSDGSVTPALPVSSWWFSNIFLFTCEVPTSQTQLLFQDEHVQRSKIHLDVSLHCLMVPASLHSASDSWPLQLLQQSMQLCSQLVAHPTGKNKWSGKSCLPWPALPVSLSPSRLSADYDCYLQNIHQHTSTSEYFRIACQVQQFLKMGFIWPC